MLRFLGQKIRDVLATLVLMSLLVFLAFYILPGDTVTLILGTEASSEKRLALEAELGLKQAPLVRYWDSLRGLWDQENAVQSLRYQQPVRSLIAGRLGLTLRLALLAFALCLLLGVPLAILRAKKAGSALDRSLALLSQVLMSIPGFFMGIILIVIFAFAWKLYRLGSYIPPAQGEWASLRSLLVPAFALCLPKLSWTSQFLRSSLIEGQTADYLRTAKAKGASDSRLLWGHLLRNSLLPFVTASSLLLAELLTGSLIVEQVFVLPGIGRLLFSAISSRDLPLAQGIIMLLATLVIVVNLLGDLLNGLIDPRLSLKRSKVKSELAEF